MSIIGSRILVVDDEPEVRELIETILDDAGFAVASAKDGPAALQIIEPEPLIS